MTAANHVMTGALVAVIVKNPLAAIPIAFLSHFVVDALPHYGYGSITREKRNQQKNFLFKQFADAFFTLALAFSVPFMVASRQQPGIVADCMFAAYFPDMIWGYHFAMAQRRPYRELNWFSRFHKSIQWCERPWGIYVEAVWFLLMAILIKRAV